MSSSKLDKLQSHIYWILIADRLYLQIVITVVRPDLQSYLLLK